MSSSVFFPSDRLHHDVEKDDHDELWYKLKYNKYKWKQKKKREKKNKP